MRVSDDAAAVAVETHDDVVLVADSLKNLAQLKHKPTPLSVKSDDFWKAIDNWLPHRGDTGVRFRFVLTSPLPSDSILRQLADSARHQNICTMLTQEAERVVDSVEGSLDDTPYKRRIAGCRAFLALTDSERLDLVQRLDVHDESFSVDQYDSAVAEQLSKTPLNIRSKVADRLIEWWDRQVALALTGKRARVLRRDEILEMIAAITQMVYSDRPSDDFADKDPPGTMDETPVLVRQIKLIDGTDFWISQAKQERWRARSQRDSWLAEEVSMAERLDRFDKRLVNEWQLRFQPITDGAATDSSAEKLRGRQLFDWAFTRAWLEVPPIHPEWRTPYLVRGTLQEMANRRIVGWHPRFNALLDEEPESGDE